MDSKETEVKKETTKKPVAAAQQRNFLATFLLVLGLGQFGANRLYTGHSTVGYTRLILSIAGILLSPVLIGVPLLLVAQIWGFVDIFMVYHGSRTDAEGNELYINTHDEKTAKILYIIFWVFLGLTIAFIILMIILAVTVGMNFDSNSVNNSSNSFDYDFSY